MKAKVKGGGIFRNVSTVLVHVIRDNNKNLSLYGFKKNRRQQVILVCNDMNFVEKEVQYTFVYF